MSLLKSDTQLNQRSYYEATAQRPAPLPVLDTDERTDVVIVGGGLAGLSAAIEMADRGYRVVVLEADHIGSGASGRNGGQALVGFASGQAELEAQLGLPAARQAWDLSVEAVRLLEQRIQEHDIDCDWVRGALTVATSQRKRKDLRNEYDQLTQIYGFDAQWLEQDVREHVASERYVAGLLEHTSGHLHPLRYTLALARVAQGKGVRIYEHSPALTMTSGEPVQVSTAKATVTANFAVLAGNSTLAAWAPDLAPKLNARIMPVGTYVMATPPLDPAQAKALIPSQAAVCDNNFVLDYYRLSADHRMLFGGRVSYTTMTPPALGSLMQRRMSTIFPSLKGVPVDYLWGGFVDISMNRAPDFGRVSPNVYYVQGFSGHGLALTGMAGRLVAEAVDGHAQRFDLLARIKHMPFPGGTMLRTPILTVGMLYHRIKDAF